MKKLVLMLGALVAFTACTKKQAPAPEPEPATPGSLVLYYSQTGSTEKVAQLIAEKTGADIEKFGVATPYDGDFNATIARCREEMEKGTVPEITPLVKDIAKYDTIYLGYPIWFGTYAPPVASLLKAVDLKGKVVIPFCTFGSGGLETSTDNLKAALPETTILDGYGVRTARVEKAAAEVACFLVNAGIVAGEKVELPDFSAAKPVTKADIAIFNAACGDYQMPLGIPVLVGSRALADATEYVFTAKNKGQKDKEAATKIYVLAPNDKNVKPEFTKVVR
jgi:flavodoxin